MDTFELDSDAFYICTEVSPRNFVVQKAIQIDKSQIERMVGKLDGKAAVERPTSTDPGSSAVHSPGTSTSTSASSSGIIAQPPPLPHWFNRECKSTLMMIGPQPPGSVPVPSSSTQQPNQFVPSLLTTQPQTREEIKQQLKIQLEYYFSRENLIQDRFLKCQMDNDQYVPITVIANFRKIMSLTTDIELITEALKESAVVELDESGEKVRAITKRTTIIIREIPESYKEEVEKLLADAPSYTELKYVSNDSWYATYDNELDTQVAYVSVQHKKNAITQRPVCVRIKAGGPPSVAPAEVRAGENGRMTTVTSSEAGTIQLREIGQTLADFGHFEYVTPTFRFSGNTVAYQQPPPLMPMPPQQPLQQQYYYSSSTSTTPRNFDELSTASSTSTRTTHSTYARSASRNGGAGHHYNESRGFAGPSNSNEWRGRVGSGGADHRRFQGNNGQQQQHQHHNESNGRQQNGRGSWRGGNRNGGGRQNHQNGHWQNENGHSGWRTSESQSQNYYTQHRHAPQAPSSSSSSVSSKYFSPEGAGTPTNSGPSTPPPVQPQAYNVPTPTDLPCPPVWPAPSFDRRRKSSEASSVTITAGTASNTLTPSTPVTPPVEHPTFDEPVTLVEVKKEQDVKEVKKELKEQKSQSKPVVESKLGPKPVPKVVPKPSEKSQSPPTPVVSSPPVAVSPSFAFEETAFPSLPKMPEPERKPQKPTFSSVLVGRRNIKQMAPEKKLSYAEKLKQRQALLRH